MTLREFYSSVLAIENLEDSLKEFATDGLAKLDAKNEKRRNTPTKAQKENTAIMESILGSLNETAKPASVIANEVGISTQKASALLGILATNEKVKVADMKNGKRTVKGYTLS